VAQTKAEKLKAEGKTWSEIAYELGDIETTDEADYEPGQVRVAKEQGGKVTVQKEAKAPAKAAKKST